MMYTHSSVYNQQNQFEPEVPESRFGTHGVHPLSRHRSHAVNQRVAPEMTANGVPATQNGNGRGLTPRIGHKPFLLNGLQDLRQIPKSCLTLRIPHMGPHLG